MTQQTMKAATKGMNFDQAFNYLSKFKSLTLIRDMSIDKLFRVENQKSEINYISLNPKSLIDNSAEVKFILKY
jgi:hypothetical protein